MPNFQTENSTHASGKPKRKEDKSEKVVHESQKSKQETPQIENGPCGESKCKSRRKKAKEDVEDSTSNLKNVDSKKSPNNVAATSSKVSSSIKADNKEKKQTRGRASNKHAGEDICIKLLSINLQFQI